MVELLLKDNRVDSTVNENEAFRIALKRGHKEVVELLYKHEKAAPSADNSAIQKASEEIVINNEANRRASFLGNKRKRAFSKE